jgi:threonine dehydrogenase-like Zn-dependent dehydrogenase
MLMKSAILSGPGTATITDVTMPEPGAGEIRVKIEGCGVCASNLEPWAGPEWMEFPTEPGALGHEAWGYVDAIGPGVRDLTVGDRVATLFDHSYADYDVGPATSAVRIPDSLAEVPVPGEPLACAMNIFRRSDIGVGQTVAIVGVGFLGAILTQLASAAGARIIAITRRPYALELARRLGASETIIMDDHCRVIETVSELTGGEYCDRVIEATGRQWPLDLAGELTRVRGRLIIAGYHQDGPRQVNMQLWNWRGLDVVNAHERDPAVYLRGMREGLAAVAEGRLSLDPLLITHTYPLDRLGEALDATRDRPDGFLKAMVLP